MGLCICLYIYLYNACSNSSSERALESRSQWLKEKEESSNSDSHEERELLQQIDTEDECEAATRQNPPPYNPHRHETPNPNPKTTLLQPGIYNWQGSYRHQGKSHFTSFTLTVLRNAASTGRPFQLSGYGKDQTGPYSLERIYYEPTTRRMLWKKRYGHIGLLPVEYKVTWSKDGKSLDGVWEIEEHGANVFKADLISFTQERLEEQYV
jgi:hypothetical protein